MDTTLLLPSPQLPVAPLSLCSEATYPTESVHAFVINASQSDLLSPFIRTINWRELDGSTPNSYVPP